jgi:hypothetical protein
MGNIITKDPDSLDWKSNEANKNNNQLLTSDARKLLGLLPDKLDESSEKPSMETIRVPSLHSNVLPKDTINTLGPRPSKQVTAPSSLMNSNSFAQSISSADRQIGGGKMLDTVDLSDTSPFISSDMYNNLINANNNIQKGGAKNIDTSANLKNTDDSSTSSTSSSDDETDKKKKKNKSDETTESVEVTDASDNSNLSYVSSSAHTGGGSSSESDVESEKSNDSNKSTEEVPEIQNSNDSNKSDIITMHDSPEVNDSSKVDDSSKVMEYSANSPELNETTPVTSPKKSKTKGVKKSKDDLSSSSSEKNKSDAESIPKVSVEEDSIENKNSNLPPSEINTSAIEMVSAS